MRNLITATAIVLLAALPVVAGSVTPPKAVLQQVATVISAHSEATRTGEAAASGDRLESALSAVLSDRSRVGDESLAVLLGLYLGEHPNEDISCELVARGKRVLEYLRKYESAKVLLPGVSSGSLQPIKTEYPVVMRRIQAGERCVREP
jgi:hypothetical protein